MINNYIQVATLGDGFSFGELALINNKPRAATIRTLAPSYFAVLDKDSYQKVLGSKFKKELSEKVEFLKSMPIFSDWTRGALEKLTFFFKEKDFLRNHYVFKEGEVWKHWYIVIDGEFEITKNVIQNDKTKIEGKILKDFIHPEHSRGSNRFEASKLLNNDTVSSDYQLNDTISSHNQTGESNNFKGLSSKMYLSK